jgi:hypothetical protein
MMLRPPPHQTTYASTLFGAQMAGQIVGQIAGQSARRIAGQIVDENPQTWSADVTGGVGAGAPAARVASEPPGDS